MNKQSNPTFRCPCGWAGQVPSFTDASEELVVDGRVVIDRKHLALCPRCLSDLPRPTEAAPDV